MARKIKVNLVCTAFCMLCIPLVAQERDASEIEHLWQLHTPELTAPDPSHPLRSYGPPPKLQWMPKKKVKKIPALRPLFYIPPPPPRPLDRRLLIGWQALEINDPFAGTGSKNLAAACPRTGLYIGGATWSTQMSGQLIGMGASGHLLDVSAFGSPYGIGSVRLDVGMQAQEVSFGHTAFQLDNATIGTSRKMRSGALAVRIGPGALDQANVRLALWFGLYESYYWSTLEAQGISNRERIDAEDGNVAGLRLTASNWSFWSGRGRLDGSLQYAHHVGSHSPAIPGSEWSTEAIAGVRMYRNPRWDFYLNAQFRLGFSETPLLNDPAFGLSATWRTR